MNGQPVSFELDLTFPKGDLANANVIDHHMIMAGVQEITYVAKVAGKCIDEKVNYGEIYSLALPRKDLLEILNLQHLVNLHSLSLDNNRIESVSQLDGLINLVYLDLSFNCIEDLKFKTGDCPRLKTLSLKSNKIRSLSSLGNEGSEGSNGILPALDLLSLENNSITEVNEWSCLANLQALKCVHAGGNPCMARQTRDAAVALFKSIPQIKFMFDKPFNYFF